MRQRHLKAVLPSPNHEPSWHALLSYLYVTEQDALFEWAKRVREVVEDAERQKRRRAA